MSSDSLQFENARFIPGADTFPERWHDLSASLRIRESAVGRARLNTPYGEHDRQATDIFFPAGLGIGTIIYVHGGYWKAFDRKYWSYLSDFATSRGWRVAVPSYRLAPEVSVAAITSDVCRAIRAVANMFNGPIRLLGHSAGGHLVLRQVCSDSRLDETILSRIENVVTISPLTDLRPFLDDKINSVLKLTDSIAEIESPVCHSPRAGIPIKVWLGSEERPVFFDQAKALEDCWPDCELRIAPGRHHFDILDCLDERASRMVADVLS